jgi:chromosome condensin MukBEF ATPase and DNA-binding subunit MukB
LERDRGAALIKQIAFNKGNIDFSFARPSDRWWWLRLKWLLEEQEKENLRVVQNMQFQLNTAVLSYSNEDQQFKHHWERANSHINKIYNSLFPWLVVSDDQVNTKKEYDELIDRWKYTFGDPADPEIAAKIQQTADMLMRSAGKWQAPSRTTRNNVKGSTRG